MMMMRKSFWKVTCICVCAEMFASSKDAPRWSNSCDLRHPVRLYECNQFDEAYHSDSRTTLTCTVAFSTYLDDV